MARRKRGRAVPLWVKPFLAGLRRTGNVEAAALLAGIDKSTVYLRRKAEPGFAVRWAAALAMGKATAGRRRRPPKRVPVELILRDGKHGPRFVRAAAGRWSAKVEAVFLAMLARTGCVRWAAAAAGMSANAFYQRRKAYPRFAADWAAAEAASEQRIPGFLTAATVASFDPEVAEELAGEDLPRVSIAEAIQIAKLKGLGAGGAAKAQRGQARPLPSIEAVRDEVLRRIAAIRRHREEGGTWP
ncbi:MAG TPA: hypothetical protein VLK25_10485 [Allosphingosinicella sp.]|nr:hypothetical protein [Allosphingosinicella sp.]